MKKVRMVTKSFSNAKNLIYEKKTLTNNVSLHFHNFYELELIIEGSGFTCLNAKRFNYKKGSIIFLTPKDFHNYEIQESTTFINVQFTFDVISKPLLFNNSFAYLEGDLYDKTVKTLELLGDMNTNLKTENACAGKLLQAVFSLVTPCFKSQETDVIIPADIKMVMAYVNAHFKENPSLEKVASLVFFNKRYFCNLFKKFTGKTYIQYLREVKLNYALNLLKRTNLSITAVALESGYTTISHFNREFYAYYQKTPSQAKKQCGNT